MNVPDGWMIYPLMEVTIGLFVILIIMLIVQIMTLKAIKSLMPPRERPANKQEMKNLSFKDMR